MFGLIGHSTSLSDARRLALSLDYEEYANGDLDMWCTAPPQLIERVEVTSRTGKIINGAYIESCFVPDMLSRFKTARRKVLNAMELAQKNNITITALGGFTSIIFENFNLLQQQQVRSTTLQWQRFTTGNTHTAWVICQQVEANAPQIGIQLDKASVAIIGATGDIGSGVCRWLSQRTDVSELLLVARKLQPLQDLQDELSVSSRIMDLADALSQADIVIWVASLPQNLDIDLTRIRRPCLMIDGGYPKNLSTKATSEGIHILKGGIVEFWNDIGWEIMKAAAMDKPQRQMFACFAEAMILDFEDSHTNFSWGRNSISVEKMDQIGAASLRHGFRSLTLDREFSPHNALATA